jgi:electron transfer flavoprotein alpha subunit
LPDVVACTFEAEGAEGLLTLARRCGDVAWLCVGDLPDDAVNAAGQYGVTVVHHIKDLGAEPGPDLLVDALARFCDATKPRLVLLNQTFDSRLIAPRLAGRLGGSVLMNALNLHLEGDATLVTASAYGGDTQAVYRMTGPSPHIVAVMPNAAQAEAASQPTNPIVEEFAVDTVAKERIRVVTPAKSEGARLEDAQVIVAGGRGLGSPANFRLVEELAAAVGGMPAASRPLVDDGWTEAARQVGLTGRITRPSLYIALGISGASQHMAGCSAAKTIVAVNRDPDAAIFRYAKYGIVGDCLELIPELIKAVREP